MTFSRRTLLTIVTEAALEVTLGEDVERLGAHGYTVSDVRGKGSRGYRGTGWEESRNIRMEIVCDRATAEAIALVGAAPDGPKRAVATGHSRSTQTAANAAIPRSQRRRIRASPSITP